jgi:hypothetical protein
MQVRLPSIFRGGGSAHSIGMPGHQYEADTPPASLCVPLARRPTSTVLNYARPTVIRAGKRNKARLRGTCGCGIDGDAGACGKLTINDTHYRAAINYVSRLLRRAHRRARNGQMRTQSVSTFQPQLLGSVRTARDGDRAWCYALCHCGKNHGDDVGVRVNGWNATAHARRPSTVVLRLCK